MISNNGATVNGAHHPAWLLNRFGKSDAPARVAKIDATEAALFDVDRRRNVAPSETLGAGGTAVFGGYIEDNETDATLRGREKYKSFSKALLTSIVGASVRVYLNLVSRAGWKWEPADDSPAAEEMAERVEAIFDDMKTPWHRVVRRASMYRSYGFSVQEWTAKRRDDGTIGFLDVAPRPQATIERWDLDEFSDVQGVVQRDPQSMREIYLPRTKLLYMIDDSLNDSPEGLGLFRHVVVPARALTRYEQLEGFGFETDLRGVPVGRAPFEELRKLEKSGSLTRAERIAIEKPLRDFIEQHVKNPALGLILDSLPYESTDEAATPSAVQQWGIDLLKGGNTSQEPVARAIERKNREIARVLGTEHLLLGSDGKGSLALAREKTTQFALIIDSALGEIAESVEDDLVDVLFDLNGWDRELKPTPKPDATQYRDVEQITAALQDLARAGVMMEPNDPAVGEVYDLIGLSRPPERDAPVDDPDMQLGGRPDQVDPDERVPGGVDPDSDPEVDAELADMLT